MSFYFWLRKKYASESNLFGRLVSLMEEDKQAPKNSENEKVIRRYLIRRQIPLRMMVVFNKSIKEYRREKTNDN